MLGIGTATPAYAVDVAGDVNVTGAFLVNGSPLSFDPAGSDTQIQFNNNGLFGASSDLTWDGSAISVGATGTGLSGWQLYVAAAAGSYISANAFMSRISIYNATDDSTLFLGNELGFARISVPTFAAFNPLRIDAQNVLFGTMSGGNVGIGGTSVTPPAYKLTVTGDVNIIDPGGANGYAYRVNGVPLSGSQWTDIAGGIYYNSGYVGIGTNAPQTGLHVNDLLWITGPYASWPTSGSGVYIGAQPGLAEISAWNEDTSQSFYLQITGNPLALGNNVGIGMLPVTYKLEVNGDVNISTPTFAYSYRINGIPFARVDLFGVLNLTWATDLALTATNGGIYLKGTPADPIPSPVSGVRIFIDSTTGTGTTGTSLNVGVSSTAAETSWIQAYTSSGVPSGNLAINPAGGNVGIGTQSPQAALDVAGAGGIQVIDPAGPLFTLRAMPNYIYLNDGSNLLRMTGSSGYVDFSSIYYLRLYAGQPGFPGVVQIAANTINFLDDPQTTTVMSIQGATARVGIGTTTPQAALDVAGDVNFRASDASLNVAQLQITPGYLDLTSSYILRLTTTTGGAIRLNSSFIQVWDDTITNPVMTMTGGNVGIGTGTPQVALEVEGNGLMWGLALGAFSYQGHGVLEVVGDIWISGLRPSDPGPGSQLLWYDPADGNRVKYSP